MDTLAENPRAVIGSNMPPPDPFETALREVGDLYEEAVHWCNGEPIATKGQADDLSKLLNQIREARKRADEARAAEKRPHDDAAAAVQARYKPILGQADFATSACKSVLTPWLAEVAEAQRTEAVSKRAEAEHLAQLAREAIQSSEATNLAERARGETLLFAAKIAEQLARKAEKARPQAGTVGRAVGLRSVRSGAIISETEVAGHYWRTDRVGCREFFQTLVDQDVRAGVQAIPGVRIDTSKLAV